MERTPAVDGILCVDVDSGTNEQLNLFMQTQLYSCEFTKKKGRTAFRFPSAAASRISAMDGIELEANQEEG